MNVSVFVFGAALFAIGHASAVETEGDPCQVVVTGFTHDRGTAIITIHAETEADAYPTKLDRALRTVSLPIAPELSVIANFGPLPSGRYAVRVHHDEDGDGKLKKRMVFPREGLGFSRDAKFRTFGPPTFDDAAFNLPAPNGIIRITHIIYP